MSGPIPERVDGAAKDKLLAIIDEATAAGWSLERACQTLQIDRRRVWRWQARRDVGALDDRRPGGNAIHGLMPSEIDAILGLAEEWGPIDRSHRKLAHRGSYLEQVWVAPSTVRRVLAAHDIGLPAAAARPAPRERAPWPEWVEYRPNQVWGYDVTHFTRCRRAPNCFAIIDLVSRKWIDTLLSPEETAIQTRNVFVRALELEDLIGLVEDRLDTGELPAVDEIPILLAVSDNGAPMTADATRAFMALCSIAQHFGRPGVPTDQAPIESFFGHVKSSGLTSRRSPTPTSSAPNSNASASSTTPSDCTPRSATSPPTTNTKDEAQRSALRAAPDSNAPTRPDAHTTATTEPTARRPPHDAD